MKVRRLHRRHAPAVQELVARLERPAPADAGEAAFRSTTHGTARAWGAFEDGRLAGVAAVRVRDGSDLVRVARLTGEDEAVEDALLARVREFARRRGATRVRTFAERPNEAAPFLRHGWPVLAEFAEMWRNAADAPTVEPPKEWHAGVLPPEVPDDAVARVVTAAFDAFAYRDAWSPVDAARERAEATCLGAFAPDGRLVGFASLRATAADVAYLGHVSVHPDVQGRGVGRAIVHAVLRVGVERAWPRVKLHVDVANEPAMRLYRRFGWREERRVRSFQTGVR